MGRVLRPQKAQEEMYHQTREHKLNIKRHQYTFQKGLNENNNTYHSEDMENLGYSLNVTGGGGRILQILSKAGEGFLKP